MKFQVCIHSKNGGLVSFSFGSLLLATVSLASLFGVAWLTYDLTTRYNNSVTHEEFYVKTWRETLNEQDEQLEEVQLSMSRRVASMVSRLGSMQAELNRLDALGMAMAKNIVGEHELTELVSGDSGAGLGGPESDRISTISSDANLNELELELVALSDKIDLRKQQLSALSDYFSTSVLQEQVYPAGFPVMKGWVSSPFGYRISPFSGQRTFHYGIDIASREEAPIRAIASGVVVFSGRQPGYGNLIEIDHGNGYTTRYAHHRKAYAFKGMTVKKNDLIALIGNEGRSTGPHLHLEVLYENRHINPLEFIKRNN